MTINLMKNY